jgi:hypothetical protein
MVKYTGVPAAVVTWILGHGRIGFSPTPKRLGRAKEVFASLHFGRKPDFASGCRDKLVVKA